MSSRLLAAAAGEFFSRWYGVLLFAVIDVVIAFAIVALAYRWFFKYFFDFLCGLVASVVTLPVWLTVAVISKVHIIKTNEYQSVFTARFVAGKGGKPVALHSFTVSDGLNGELTSLGRFLRRTGIEKLPAVFDLLTLKTSLVGVKPLSVTDEKFIAEEDYDRFAARPGYFNPLLTAGEDAGRTYEDMFRSDKNYDRKCGLFTDCAILLTALVRKIRGEKENIFGEAAEKDYCEVLLERGEITQAVYDQARAEEKDAEEYEEYEEYGE